MTRTQLLDQMAVTIFRHHVASILSARRLAEQLLFAVEEASGQQLAILEEIHMALATPETLSFFAETYHLSPQQAVLLEYLVKREALSLGSIMTLLQCNNSTARVVLSRLRAKTGLPIINKRGEGYYLRADARGRLATQLTTGQGA